MIRIFCLVYGEAFVDLFERVSVRSLLQPRNLSVLPKDTVVSLYCDRASADRAAEIASWLGTVEVTIIDPRKATADALHDATVTEIEKCLRLDATMIMATPDMFWGDGSLGNLLAIGEGRKVCVGAAHPRVNRDEFLNNLPDGVIANDQLVTLAMQNLHRTWIDADVSLERTNTWVSGITIRRLSDKLHAVQHLLPNIYLARFNESDLKFFVAHEKRGLWDHHWPGLLVAQQRQRLIGSSDAFFAVELTAREQNHPPLSRRDQAEPDKFRGIAPHHAYNRNFLTIWRSR